MSGIRVLIADDNKAIREVLVSKLSNQFDEITAVNDGGEALAAAQRLHPDLAILDISMPILNGIEVARRIRQAHVDTAMIFLTGCTDLDVFNEAVATGALAYVLKPRLWTDLMPAIELALAGARYVSPGLVDSGEERSRLGENEFEKPVTCPAII